MATILEHSEISPPASAMTDLSLPLLFFDMLWYEQPVSHFVLFYESDCSKPQFLADIIPSLKHSLSLTLTHFLPLAGNIVHPRTPAARPTVQFRPGKDYVSFTVCESKLDNFSHLIGNHSRDCSDFYEYVPQLPPPTHSRESVEVPVLALKVTLFPGCGVAFGFEACHMFVDASTIVSFFRAWAFTNSKISQQVEEVKLKLLLQENGLFPFYDRTAFVDINGLDSTYCSLIAARPDSLPILPWKHPGDKVRSTFVLNKVEIKKLKNFVLQKVADTEIPHLSSFSVICALVWSCMAKSDAGVPDDEPDYFSYVADCRGRVAMDPPLPRNYLGNCCANFTICLKHGDLKGDEGFVRAAVFISEAIGKTVYGEKGILHGAERWLPELWNEGGKRLFWVAGSPRFDFYEVDFGWGRPSKVEALFTDSSTSISLWKSRWVEGGLEIGLSKPKPEMEALIAVFKKFLNDLCRAGSWGKRVAQPLRASI